MYCFVFFLLLWSVFEQFCDILMFEIFRVFEDEDNDDDSGVGVSEEECVF